MRLSLGEASTKGFEGKNTAGKNEMHFFFFDDDDVDAVDVDDVVGRKKILTHRGAESSAIRSTTRS